ncbi:MAG: LPP20 family lipoprotein [Arcobacteraceae bacterium]|nr:LPP20 family lipoprotein [Arcobacteraceae bacterium]
MALKYIFLTIFVIFLSGCGKSIQIEPKKVYGQIPSWYISPPNNDENFLYGLGEANNMDLAQKIALENLSARLSVNISSKLESYQESYRDFREYTKKSTKHNISSEITKLFITNYKIINSKQLANDRFIVLIAIKRLEMIKILRNEVEALYKKTLDEDLMLKQRDPLTRMLFYKNTQNEFQEAVKKVQILENLDPLFTAQKYFNINKEINFNFNQLKESMTISIDTDKNSEQFIDLVRNALLQKGFKVIDKKYNGANHIRLIMRSNTTINNAYGLDIIKVLLTTEVLTNAKRHIGGNTINLKGGSSQGVDDAKSSLNRNLAVFLKNQGSHTLFGEKYKILFSHI